MTNYFRVALLIDLNVYHVILIICMARGMYMYMMLYVL